MIGKIVVVIGALLLSWGLSACGTIEIDMAAEDEQGNVLVDEVETSAAEASVPAPVAAATETPQIEMTATPLPTADPLVAEITPTAAVQDAPADWQRFYDAEYGIDLWHPAGTIAVIGEPSRPVFSSTEFPDGIVEEQLFVVRVVNEEGGPFGPPGPQAMLEVKVVANPEEQSVAQIAELYSKRCPGPVPDTLQPTTVSVQLSGYRFSCEGIDGLIFNEFWAPHPSDAQLLVGAAWTDMSAPLADDILATVTLAG